MEQYYHPIETEIMIKLTSFLMMELHLEITTNPYTYHFTQIFNLKILLLVFGLKLTHTAGMEIRK